MRIRRCSARCANASASLRVGGIRKPGPKRPSRMAACNCRWSERTRSRCPSPGSAIASGKNWLHGIPPNEDLLTVHIRAQAFHRESQTRPRCIGVTMTRHPQPIHDTDIDWVPLREGLSFRPLHFEQDGYSLQLRLEPGTLISHHRHTGEVHAFNLCGERELIEDGVIAGPGAPTSTSPRETSTAGEPSAARRASCRSASRARRIPG